VQVCDKYNYDVTKMPELGGVAWEDVAFNNLQKMDYCSPILLGTSGQRTFGFSQTLGTEQYNAVKRVLLDERLGSEEDASTTVEGVADVGLKVCASA
jgi:hypothetical protein